MYVFIGSVFYSIMWETKLKLLIVNLQLTVTLVF